MTNPFKPYQATRLINVTTSASAPVLLGGCEQVLVTNEGDNTVFLAFGNSAVSAVIPTDVAPSSCVPVLPYSAQTFNRSSLGEYVSAITSTGTAKLYLTPGEGL